MLSEHCFQTGFPEGVLSSLLMETVDIPLHQLRESIVYSVPMIRNEAYGLQTVLQVARRTG